MQDPKNGQKFVIWAPSHNFIGLYLATKACIDNRKKLVKQQCVSPTCPYNMVNVGPLAAEICWRVWGTPAHFTGVRVFAALLHGTLVVGVSQTLQRWTDGTTYIFGRAAITLGIGPNFYFRIFHIAYQGACLQTFQTKK